MAYSYGEAETALAKAFHVSPDEQPRWFRARIKHLQKLGVPFGLRSGKGIKHSYTLEQVLQWAVCLEFAEFGIDPSRVVNFVQRYWRQFAEALSAEPPTYLDARIMIFAPAHGSIHKQREAPGKGPALDVDQLEIKPMRQIEMFARLYLQGGLDRLTGPRRVAAVNLTLLAKMVGAGLKR